jgi:hypothetical protein
VSYDITVDKGEARFFPSTLNNYLRCLVLLVDIDKVNKAMRNRNDHSCIYRNQSLDISIKYTRIDTGDCSLANIQDVAYFNSNQFKQNTGIGNKKYTREIL